MPTDILPVIIVIIRVTTLLLLRTNRSSVYSRPSDAARLNLRCISVIPALRPDQILSCFSILTLTGDLNVVTEVAGLAVNLDAVVQVLLESGGVKDTVVGGAGEVDEELVGGLALLGASLGGLLNSHFE